VSNEGIQGSGLRSEEKSAACPHGLGDGIHCPICNDPRPEAHKALSRLAGRAYANELHELRMQLTHIDDRLSTLKAEAEALLRKRAPIEARIREIEDKLP